MSERDDLPKVTETLLDHIERVAQAEDGGTLPRSHWDSVITPAVVLALVREVRVRGKALELRCQKLQCAQCGFYGECWDEGCDDEAGMRYVKWRGGELSRVCGANMLDLARDRLGIPVEDLPERASAHGATCPADAGQAPGGLSGGDCT